MSGFGLSVRHYAGKQDLSWIPLQLSSLFRSCGLWTLPCDFVPHNYKTLKWLSSLPILMQVSFWWWQCGDRYIISLFPHRYTPFPISIMASFNLWTLGTMFTYFKGPKQCNVKTCATQNKSHMVCCSMHQFSLALKSVTFAKDHY